MLKKLLFTIPFAISSLMATAGNLAVKVLLTDGTSVNCSFAEKPQITFEDEGIILTSEKGNVGKWEFTGVASWSFFEEGNSDNVNNISNNTSVVINGDEIIVNGQTNSSVSVWGVSGKLFLMQNADENGTATLSINGLDSGVYILKAGSNTIKFIVK